jgi:hypothetical protein
MNSKSGETPFASVKSVRIISVDKLQLPLNDVKSIISMDSTIHKNLQSQYEFIATQPFDAIWIFTVVFYIIIDL